MSPEPLLTSPRTVEMKERSVGWLGALRLHANVERRRVDHRIVYGLLFNRRARAYCQGPAEWYQAQFVVVEILCCPHLYFGRQFALLTEQDDAEVLSMFFCG